MVLAQLKTSFSLGITKLCRSTSSLIEDTTENAKLIIVMVVNFVLYCVLCNISFKAVYE